MIEGDTSIPSVTGTPDNDEPLPNCPGWDFIGPKYETMVSGITQGPSDPNVTSVAIRLRDSDGDAPRDVFRPLEPKGKFGVVLLSTKLFDAAKVDPSTVQAGPGKAAPLSSTLLPASKDRRKDEDREDWERSSLELKKTSDSELHDGKDLLLVFDEKAVGIRCGLDHALFLTGKTKSGRAIAGAKAVHIEGCNSRKPYVTPGKPKQEDVD